MVLGAIRYTSRPPLYHIDGTLKSVRFISGVLRSVALHFIRALRNPTFQQDNAQPHATGIVRTFLDMENVKMFGCFPCLHVHQISNQYKTSGPRLPSDWLVTIRQSLRLMSCSIVLKLHGHLYLYLPSNL
ncbi:transposable element Tcb1 transposase [Trichonephila clavipes]|nr:transposable element Tcb1 transposase [Trichonephila clavipes]